MAIIYAFVKIFEKEKYAEDFVAGKLYMNTIRYFQKYRDEAGEFRGDEYEGIAALYQPNKISRISIDGIEIPSSELASPIVVHFDELLRKNAFCIYSLNNRGCETASADDFKRTVELHESCFGLGNFCVAIINAHEFIDRCQVAVRKNSFSGSLGLVDYYNEHELHGSLPSERLGYQKRSFFGHQREYRLLIDTSNSRYSCQSTNDAG